MALLVIAFIAIPIVELYVIIQVGQAIGVLPTVALLLADAVLGWLLLRHQGRGARGRIKQAKAHGGIPGGASTRHWRRGASRPVRSPTA